ncbi:protein Gawky isoform X1 [Amyelois transitella]|uniref:protein Gawky isoform X1 n=1 Tax=Amyelois transitella TaxID=680683 RepID=UPI00067DEAF9|nr:protein Gawky isoform X1 [Amyelois transitella]XP_013199684.1 protein Gawky isoform X1 [Amyelois transitella]XP_060802994.1 protein Gawky isoform X1 [Amyelois transitella]
MSNVSVILCVPHLIKDNCYSNIDTVTVPMQCNYSTSKLAVNTNKFGAFERVDDKNESQRVSVKMIDNNIYNVEFVDSTQQNQMIGDTPTYCIPLMINAITVQGISYSDPYFSSFNLKYKMAFGAPEYMNKSDYAFKSSVCIKRDEPCESKLFNEKSAHNIVCKTKTRMITYDDKLSTHHDNNGVGKRTSAMRQFADGDLTLDAMLELTKNEERMTKAMRKDQLDSWGVPRILRLRGGGESSLNAATGWGSPPANNSAGNWGGNSSGQTNNGSNNTQQWNNTAQRPPTSQADMNSNKGNGNQMPPTSAASGQNWQSSPPNMPNSQPNNNGAPANNGTNNGGNGNNGGTNQPNAAGNANGPSPNGNNGNSMTASSAKIEQLNSMREILYSQDGWGGQHVNQDTNWDVPGSPEPGSKVEPTAGGPAWKPNVNTGAFLGTDLWEANLRNGGQPPPQPAAKTPWGHTPTTNIGGTWGEDDDTADSANVWTGPPPQQQWPAGPPQHAQQWGVPKKDDWNAWGEPHRQADPRLDPHRTPDLRQQSSDPRHDLRGGISGRLNGDMWSQHHQHAGGPNKMMPAGAVNQWGAQGPKDTMKGSGWEEPSPPAARRAAGGFDDGTSLWQRSGMPGMAGRGAPQGPPVAQRIPPTPTKPDGVWGAHGQRNGTWEEPHAPGWPERDANPGWPDAAAGPALWSVPKQKPGPGGWPDDIGEWGGPKPPQSGPLGKQIPKELIWNSKQFRVLVEMGFKKEEAEAALRSRDMNTEEALEILTSARGEQWRRDEQFPGHHGPFQPPPSVPAVSPAVVQKLLNQPPPQAVQHHHSYPNSGTGSGQPSAAQLRMLVQQIQMAVSAGYLNHQILNQPLASQTLVLLNQLLQQIKVLQQLTQSSLTMSKGNTSLALQYTMQITKAKQQIAALQNQIATQQALFMKQQAGGGDIFKQSHDPLAQLQNNFSDMGIAKESQGAYGASGNQQSRLNQWKLPSLDKDGEGSEFSRAPGTAKSTTSPQLNQLDSTWGVGRGEGWGDSGADVADGKDAWPAHPSHQPVYDLVPEFEPGKPWKGNQMKSAEDDPAMTPGSVVRSPLSLAAIKDTDMLGGKTSPPGERLLSSSTWSYAPPATSAGPGVGSGGLKAGADAWSGSKPRPAPPGLNKAWPQHSAPRVPSWQASTWLLLKNLTAQIDGSTLKTLCVQHGPLQNFHLYLNQGFALARYSTREEAAKAQMALNNCVLSNTTIFAESPADSDVHMILQHLGNGGGGGWRAGGKDWAFPTLWPDHDQRATPSSLNSFLPPDLLSGDTI